jgi:hypothetical protein
MSLSANYPGVSQNPRFETWIRTIPGYVQLASTPSVRQRIAGTELIY